MQNKCQNKLLVIIIVNLKMISEKEQKIVIRDRRLRKKVSTNNMVFAFIMLLLQVMLSALYGVFARPANDIINISEILAAILLALLVVVGFGLVFSYLKRMLLSGIGFNLLIIALCIQLFPLVNALWTKVGILNVTTKTGFGTRDFTLLLSNRNTQNDLNKQYGNSIIGSMKCALSLIVAFSSILGRAGALECLISTVIGTIGYQANRQLVLNYDTDAFGSYYIFIFGGFMGLSMGLAIKLRHKDDGKMKRSYKRLYRSNLFGIVMSLIGSMLICAIFPVLAYQYETFNNYNTFNIFNVTISIMLAISSSIIGAIAISILFNNNIVIRDLIHAPIAGGIAVGSAAFYITEPYLAFVIGLTAGIIQTFIQNLIQRWYMKNYSIISSVSWSLFGIQGLIGAFFAMIMRRALQNDNNGFIYNPETLGKNAVYQLVVALISVAMGLASGAFSALFIDMTNKCDLRNSFNDKTFWVNDDGISYPKQQQDKKIERPAAFPAVKRLASNIYMPQNESGLSIKQGQGDIHHNEYEANQDESSESDWFDISFSQEQEQDEFNTYL